MNPAENLIFQQTRATPRYLFHSRPAKSYYLSAMFSQKQNTIAFQDKTQH